MSLVKCEIYAMSTRRKIFDMRVLKMRQNRSQKLRVANFVEEFTIKSVVDILLDIQRSFTTIALIGGKDSFWEEALGYKDLTFVKDAEILDFQNKKFDLIINVLSLHHSNDPVGQLIQMRHALKPDGLMLTFFLGGDTLQELRTSFQAAEIKVENGISPRVAPMIEIKDAGNLLVRAGFALTVADKTNFEVTYKSPMDLFYELRAMGETNILIDRKKTFLRRSTLNELITIYSSNYRTSDGEEVRATFQLFCLTGWAPAENQQKPLRPGSAKVHFSEILNTYKS